ncbi:hypothetical protein PFFVO_03834 [Plasmodium falciparum Vietnam Oak-Knoll (FVO)]|uniref:Surface antigen n=1 Tax=Plasmodium falciparum Vietnam Oak-Knoll (FVO) TaxID=1036723 RepID=A0A024V3X6_PLAFA|nr:hypothetical protein PFFVO_03834 [Plasmodium falciparum Vietnam Oak-Knoll (FVO)]
MKVHYFNIFLFSLTLKIILLSSGVYNKRNHILTFHKPTTTSRLLCECELYASANYNNDPEMQKVMENYNRQTSQRFEEYNERVIKNRQKCKEQWDKDKKKIILKDKIEKELTEKLAALQTDISTNDIPTCFCEKSLPDKVEKSCLKCGKNLGGFVPGLGLIGGTAVYAAAVNAATKAGITKTMEGLSGIPGLENLIGSSGIEKIVTPLTYNKGQSLFQSIYVIKETKCVGNDLLKKSFCNYTPYPNNPFWYSSCTQQAAIDGAEAYGTTFVTETSPTTFLTNPYIASSIAVMIIVATILVIYLILRYRRKKKMNKKLQYIKLLKE